MQKPQQLTHFVTLFPKPLMVANTSYAHQVLLYMQRRPELELSTIGLSAIPYLRNSRHVKDEFVATYYQYLAGIVRQLLRYASLEESCSMSGAYTADRLKTVELVRTALLKFDAPEDPGVFGYLDGMLDIPPAG